MSGLDELPRLGHGSLSLLLLTSADGATEAQKGGASLEALVSLDSRMQGQGVLRVASGLEGKL